MIRQPQCEVSCGGQYARVGYSSSDISDRKNLATP